MKRILVASYEVVQCPECAESLFEITGYTIQEVIQKMATLGFEMIEDTN